jgi:hypothetical protein
MWPTMMLRAVVCFSLMTVLSGVFPDVCLAVDSKGVAPSAWPEKGAVNYRASFGSGGAVIGQGHYSWSHNGEKYQMRLALETTGMTAVLYKLDYVQLSQGNIGKDGLRPLRFDVTQQGREPEAAIFDWDGASGARVSIRRGARERHNLELAPGDQDILSIWRQIGHMGDLPDGLLVVGNKNARHARVERLGDVDLNVPAGRFATRRFRVRSEDGKLRIELWLATARHMVPVRIVLGNDKAVDTLIFEATNVGIPSGI